MQPLVHDVFAETLPGRYLRIDFRHDILCKYIQMLVYFIEVYTKQTGLVAIAHQNGRPFELPEQTDQWLSKKPMVHYNELTQTQGQINVSE